MRHSLEEVGVNVSKLSKRALDHEIQWYVKSEGLKNTVINRFSPYVPEQNIMVGKIDYLTKVFGVLTNQTQPDIDDNKIYSIIHDTLKRPPKKGGDKQKKKRTQHKKERDQRQLRLG